MYSIGVYLDNPFSTPSTTGAVGLPARTTCIGFKQVCCTSLLWVIGVNIHSGLHEIKFTEVLSDCPSPSGLIMNTFLLLSYDGLCTATDICGYSVLTTPSPTDSCASTIFTCLLCTPHSHVRTHHKNTKIFIKITKTDIFFKFTIPEFLIWTELKVAVIKRTSPQNCNNPGVLVVPVWLSHVCLTGFDVLWERLVSVWWLGIDWRHFHVADRIG